MSIKITHDRGSGYDRTIPGFKPAEPKRVDGATTREQRQIDASVLEAAVLAGQQEKLDKQQNIRQQRSDVAGAQAAFAVALETAKPGEVIELPDGTKIYR
jgi:hypothetical protein